MTKFVMSIVSFIVGFILIYIGIPRIFSNTSHIVSPLHVITEIFDNRNSEVVGFLPYWLLSKADKQYSDYLTTLTYFGLIISDDGTIQKFVNPGEAEPGWHALNSGKVDAFLDSAKQKNIKRSLLIFNGDTESINSLLSKPEEHAVTVISEVAPIMKKYEFTDLNVDIESFVYASDSARINFTLFIQTLKKEIDKLQLGTLTIDASPTDLIRKRLIDLESVQPYVDLIVLMTYDYHYMGSIVSGPVAPIGGAGVESEFDVETGVQKAIEVLPKHKILLGVPLYGYSWETLSESTRSATLPGSGQVISNRRIEELLLSCATCSAQFDSMGKESYVIYKDSETNTFHHVYYPDKKSMEEKISLTKTYDIGGIALWALGYDGDTILQPLQQFKNSN